MSGKNNVSPAMPNLRNNVASRVLSQGKKKVRLARKIISTVTEIGLAGCCFIETNLAVTNACDPHGTTKGSAYKMQFGAGRFCWRNFREHHGLECI
jgi:hypothetical protein